MRDTINITQACNKLRPFLGKKIDDIFLEYIMAYEIEKKKEIFQLVLALYSRYVDSSFLQRPVVLDFPDVDLQGGYYLGELRYPNKQSMPFGLNENDWNRHVCISGMTGSGKTTFAVRIINNFIKKKKPFIVFDWKKSFRQLLHISNDVMIFTVGRPNVSNFFRFNINKPPEGVPPDEWITVLCDLLCECYGASYGVHKLLTEVMQKTFRDFGVYSGSNNYPTWYHIKDRLAELAEKRFGNSRMGEWLTSAQRIVHNLTFSEFGQTINDVSDYNITVEELLENKVVFELDALGSIEKKLFCSSLLLYIYKLMKARSVYNNNPFTSAILVDEAHNIFLKNRPIFVHESITDIIYREIREYGIGLICLDQHISKLSDTVLGNSSTHVAFQQMLPHDVECVSKLMFLEENRDFFTKLKVGQCIVKLSDRYYDPFIMHVEKIDTGEKIFADDKLREITKSHCLYKKRKKIFNDQVKTENLARSVYPSFPDYECLKSSVKKEYLANYIQKEIYNEIIPALRRTGSIREAKSQFLSLGFSIQDVNMAFRYFLSTKEGQSISKFLKEFNKFTSHSKYDLIEIKDFLHNLQRVDCSLNVARLYKEFGISGRKGNGMKNFLTELGLVTVHEHKTDRGMTKKIRLTPAGLELMAKIHMDSAVAAFHVENPGKAAN